MGLHDSFLALLLLLGGAWAQQAEVNARVFRAQGKREAARRNAGLPSFGRSRACGAGTDLRGLFLR